MGVPVDGCAASQRDLCRLEKWAKRSLVKFGKGGYKALHLGIKTRPGAHQRESSFAEKSPGVLAIV